MILLEYEEYHWLTFGIKRNYETDYLENLVLKYDISHDIYEAFIAKYDITSEERETIKNGGVVQNLDLKTEIHSIKEYHLDVANRTGIYTDSFGNCYIPKDIVLYIDGSVASITWEQVPCPGEGGSNNNGNENGDGNNNGSEDGDNNSWDDGNDGSNFPDDTTDSNNGGSSGNENNNEENTDLPDDNLDNTVATLPNPETTPISNHEENCEKLLALNLTDSLSVNIVPYIDSLETQTSEDKEYSISFRKNINYGETYSYADPEGIRDGTSSTGSFVRIGSTWFGQAHTHPEGTHYMFSWNDINQLNNLYNGLSDLFDKREVFMMIVNHDGTVYALKIDDPAILNTEITNDLFNAEGST
ncbi:MAG: hypothetical protein HRU26_10950, partial [Psychroserpens sp.]|nr:hypothetical protein [Psychroserpens sp.]